MGFDGFVFSEQTSALSDEEFSHALDILAKVAAMVEARDAKARSDPGGASLILPDEGWHADSQPSFELDGSTKNAQTYYALLAQGDRDIIRKMRLYGHAFTGYQLATLSLAEHRPWLSRKLPDNWDETLSFLAGPPDQSVFDYAAVANALPAELRAAPPEKFGEIGWRFDGAIVNDDTYSCLERLCLMYENGLIDDLRGRDRTLRVIEIGGGYGGLAYQLMTILDRNIRYAIIDIPESLAFSGIYCSTLFPGLDNAFVENEEPIILADTPGFTFIPNTHRNNIAGGADLVINTLSLSEMSDAQIKDYCALASGWIGADGVFFEQNHQANHTGPGGFLPDFFHLLQPCLTQLLPDTFSDRRGDANLWVNAGFKKD